MALKFKTAAGLLLVIISCLVVAMLGYRAYAEGFAEGVQPRKNVVEQANVVGQAKAGRAMVE